MNRIGKGLGSLILLAVLLVGIPAGLVFFVLQRAIVRPVRCSISFAAPASAL